MPYVVTQSCCSDGACVVACPVNAIHPAPGEPGFATAEMLYVDPVACVDCGACFTACPVEALQPHTKLSDAQLPFIELNAAYYREHPHADRPILAAIAQRPVVDARGLKVAVIGAGPAGLYAADELLKHEGVSVDVFDRLPTPHGLARYGVAPDHPKTKQVIELFGKIEREPGFRYRLNVEAGTDVTVEELRSSYHAVIYAVGAATDRRLGVPGEDLAGSSSATDFVAWYNGHPDADDVHYPLEAEACERAVVIGNGNVALDVARILTADPDELAATDISDRALLALRDSRVQEVVVLGRRGPADAAFTLPELIGLAGHDDIDVLVEGGVDAVEVTSQKTEILAELAARTPTPGRRRIVLRFHSAPVRLVGDASVEGIEVARTEVVDGRAVLTDDVVRIDAGLVLRAVGYRARPVAGLPFDDERALVPNEAGRVEPGLYVGGWIKRGATGFIGTNKSCSTETVAQLLDDYEAGLLSDPTTAIAPFDYEIDHAGWLAIDRTERALGEAADRPRVKLTDRRALSEAATPVVPRYSAAHAVRPSRSRTRRATAALGRP
ncbi:4Fe-4S dicluster domain-containing protein [Nocardioides humilatus]|uniref:ferredoxin--NADP(+) reductase n=1 Tax=Nocardioides humilatus TaxID=2607660 RepID=A0A5B1LLS0_9ACTN|nr:FAD-dependent oxidoreductase [Nocardioides humilatus]KAA1421715.1 4Fe-4S dicluster domain-containing protein [Nocardioides humilatus]